ncbi:hypothetical protein [Amycolatopsis sp. H20-H5]|uniref:hypothetical protein n=1 Tax=Amycolatopsis sp. H20-H5 TaxID=3046309 RepID=UPI002DB8E1AA|nr:hypothetical protein [Amycolatopsis sp. H20-H5]MEC3976161.1 hypothetical protein [Amycolatopsis sp. H20-H5]
MGLRALARADAVMSWRRTFDGSIDDPDGDGPVDDEQEDDEQEDDEDDEEFVGDG